MSAPGVRVFYAGLLYGEYTRTEWEQAFTALPMEIYEGGYVHINQVRYLSRFGPALGWYRMDGTPVLDQDVPKELRLLLLLLT